MNMTNDLYVLRKNNLLVTGSAQGFRRDGYAVYEIKPKHRGFWNPEDYHQDLLDEETIISKLNYPGMFLKVPVNPEPESQLRADQDQIPEAFKKEYENTVKRQTWHIQKVQRYAYRVYLILGVRELTGKFYIDVPMTIWETFRDPIRRLEYKLGIQPYTLADSQWARFQKDEEVVHQILSSHYDLKRLTDAEMDMLLNRVHTRGVNPSRSNRKYEIELSQHNGLVTGSPDDCTLPVDDVDHDPADKSLIWYEKSMPEGTKKGCLSFLAVNRLPKGQSIYPFRTALFHNLTRQFDFPLEISVIFEPIHWTVAKMQTGLFQWLARKLGQNRLNKGKDADEHIEQVGSSKRLMKKLDDESPMFKMQVIVCVWGKDREEVVRRRSQVANALKDQGYSVVTPRRRQKHLFYATIPAQRKKFGATYTLKKTSDWLAATMPTGGMRLGDDDGFPIGYWTRYPNPVFYNFRRANQGNADMTFAPHILLFGASGAGKSTLANYLVVEQVKRGAKALIFDPKNERVFWLFEIPWLKDKIEVVTLEQSEWDRGKLDPLLRVLDPERHQGAIDSAKRIMWHLANCSAEDFGGKAIGYAIDLVVERYFNHRSDRRPCMTAVIEVLEEYLDGNDLFSQGKHDFPRAQAEPEVQRVLSNLVYNQRSSLAQLLFARGDEEAVDFQKPLTILQVRNLRTPKREDPDYRIHSAIFMAITDVCRNFVEEPGERCVMLDELYTFTAKNSEMKEEIRLLLRQGRSQDNTVILSTHNIRDLVLDEQAPDAANEVISHIGMRCVYRVDDRNEAKTACDLLGITPNKDNIQLLTSRKDTKDQIGMISGRYILQDFNGRKGLVDFPLRSLDPVMFEAFRTDREALSKKLQKYGHLLNEAQQQIIQEKLEEETGEDSENEHPVQV